MLKRSSKNLILSAALLMPATAFAQQKSEAKAEQAKPVVEVTEEIVIDEVSEETAATIDGEKQVEKSSKPPIELRVDAEGNHEIRVIEVDGDDMPKQIRVIMKSLNGLDGDLKDKDGKPQVLSFSFGSDGKLKATTSKIDQTIQEAIESIHLSVDGVQGKGTEERIFRLFQNGKPGAGQLNMLKAEAIDLKGLSKELAGVNGTISISTSSSSSSKNGEEPNVVTNSQVRIIGPDGNVQEMNFDGKGLGGASLSKAVDEAMKKSGREIPDDVRKRIEKALSQARQRATSVRSQEIAASIAAQAAVAKATADAKTAVAQATSSAKAAVAKAKKDHERKMAEHNKQVAEMQKQASEQASSSVERKLDLILKRLEKMEQEIETLKKN